MFLILLHTIIINSLLWSIQASTEERRVLILSDLRYSLKSATLSVLFFSTILVFISKVLGEGIIDAKTAHLEIFLPLLNYGLLKRAESRTAIIGTTIATLLLVGGFNIPKLIKFTILETVYMLLGSITVSIYGWSKPTTDNASLYDYFSTGLTALCFGTLIVTSKHFQQTILANLTSTAATACGMMVSSYYNLKLFLSPVFLAKYLPLSATGNSTVIYITFVTLIAATTVTIPLLIYLIDKIVNVKLLMIFIFTYGSVLMYKNFNTFKDVVLISSPVTSVPLLGSYSST